MSRSRNFVFTLNNYTAEEEEAVKVWECVYLIFGKEVGESGTPHLQGYVSFEHQRTLQALKKLSLRAHWEIARGTPKQASEYCEKDGIVFEKGTRPMSQAEKGDAGKRSFDEAFVLYKAKKYEEMGQFALQLKSFDYLDAKLMKRDLVVTQLDDLVNEWHWGVPGSGKSHVRYDHPGHYVKKTSKWWNGYTNQEVVVMDEFSRYHVALTDDLKEWAGEHAFPAETKCGQLEIRPKKMIVTSQENPAGFWTGDHWLAIERRFKFYYWGQPYYVEGKKENGRNPLWYDPRIISPRLDQRAERAQAGP